MPNAHQVLNESNEPCSYLIVGTRLTHDVCHYPDVGKVLHTEAKTDAWKTLQAMNSSQGRSKQSGIDPELPFEAPIAHSEPAVATIGSGASTATSLKANR